MDYPGFFFFKLFLKRRYNNTVVCVTCEDSDQPGHPTSLIRVFHVLMTHCNFRKLVKVSGQTGQGDRRLD